MHVIINDIQHTTTCEKSVIRHNQTQPNPTQQSLTQSNPTKCNQMQPNQTQPNPQPPTPKPQTPTPIPTNQLYGAQHYSRGHQLCTQQLPAFYGIQRFITTFTRALQWLLSWARPIQSIPPQPISPRSILILSTHLCLGLPSGIFPSGFPTSILHTIFSPFMLHGLPISSLTCSF
jgi:hypothetical protein